MSPHTRLSVSLLAFGAALSRLAFAEDATPPERVAHPSLALGATFGDIAASDLKIDGHRQRLDGSRGSAGVVLKYAQGLVPYLGAVVVGRFGSEATEWSEERGETRTRGELGLGPEVLVALKAQHAFVNLRLDVPVGPTWAWFRPHSPLGATERYSTGTGFNLSVIAGVDIFWGHHGCFTELGYLRQWTTLTHTATLAADSAIRSTERYRLDQQSVVFALGYAYRF